MAMTMPSETAAKMIAEWQIRDVIGRYARGVDRRDGALIRRCFHQSAEMHYGDFDGTIDAFVPWVLDYVEQYSGTMHFMGNTVIDWPEHAADRVVAETYATAWHEIGGDNAGRSWVGGIRYLDRFECRPSPNDPNDAWRVAERTVVGDWLRIDPADNHRRFGKEMLIGRPGGDDPIYKLISSLAG